MPECKKGYVKNPKPNGRCIKIDGPTFKKLTEAQKKKALLGSAPSFSKKSSPKKTKAKSSKKIVKKTVSKKVQADKVWGYNTVTKKRILINGPTYNKMTSGEKKKVVPLDEKPKVSEVHSKKKSSLKKNAPSKPNLINFKRGEYIIDDNHEVPGDVIIWLRPKKKDEKYIDTSIKVYSDRYDKDHHVKILHIINDRSDPTQPDKLSLSNGTKKSIYEYNVGMIKHEILQMFDHLGYSEKRLTQKKLSLL